MCGVAAVLGAVPGHDPEGWERSLARLSRRGPDGAGQWRSPSGEALLGHRRLAVLDVSDAGRQPMTSENGRVAVVFNGEIYNAPALRAELAAHGHRFASLADTEVLVHGYEQWGSRGLLERIRGMFAFVLWDEDTRRALAAVDHAGMKPLVWSLAGGALRIASDCDALRENLPENPPLDPVALCHVLCLGYCPAPSTVWRGVSKLCPGHAMVWSPGAAPEIFRHWAPPECDGAAPAAAEFDELWESVVSEHLHSDVPVGLLLSAGLDSSAVALALARAGRAIPCTTLALPGGADESGVAGATAAALGHPHRRVALDHADVPDLLTRAAEAFDEPQGFGALLTMTRVAEAVRAQTKVVLAGDGGDEAFAGYAWHRTPPRAPAASGPTVDAARLADPDTPPAAREQALAQLAGRSFVHAYLQAVMPRFHPAEAASLLSPLGARYDEEAYASWLAHEDRPALPWPRRAQRLDLAGFCPGSILPKVDRAAMRVGLEVRTPFLDRRILEWALARPADPAELDACSAKPPLRRYLRGRVPDDVLRREKQGFSLRLGRTDTFTSMDGWLATTKLVREGVLAETWRTFIAHGVPNREGRAFALCMIAAWAEARL
jgi:asparagine synthase (glutamine-hydrolysing)